MDNERPPSLSVVQDKDDHAVPLPNVAKTPDKPAKKTTRQWAAWTRQEEENFFSALRQVGKNFEKITSRVQSKNKEQVRHYYYRLVRRMKKLLGPGFGLDAKNSKETIAAMLRWWSLLEKHSCTASKLHLKPRRFKTFIEALAHQLLKDRNKTRRRRPTQGEAFLPATPATGSVLGMGLGNDSHPVKLFYVDGQNNRKVGSKGTCIGANDSYSRGSLTNIKTMKQRRRSGLVASTAYKRWEKAAIDGVSLVADAAACLERSTMDENSPYDHVTSNVLPATNSNTCFPEGICCAGIAGEATSSANISGNHTQTVPYIQPLTKLKLQLFPLDDITRKALEKDEHNPYLELALSTRKKITSVIDHLNRKWGKSSIAAGELTLFPYNMHPEDVSYCPRWTQKDTYATAADIFITVGSPLIFRLRYAWLSNCDSRIIQLSASRIHLDNQIKSSDDQVQNAVNASNLEFEDADRRSEESPTMVAKSIALPSDNVDRIILTSEEPGGLSMFPQDAVSPDIQNEVDSRKEHKDYKAMSHGSRTILSAGRWADSLTNISVGELLSEASRDAFSFRNGPVDSAAQFLPKTSMSSDSFDAVIASHLQGFRNQQSTLPTDSHQSIWDAEETCDGFSFSLLRSHNADVPGNSATGSPGCAIGADSTGYPGLPENIEPTDGNQSDGDEELKDISQLNEEQTYSYSENSLGLADISWLDSSGALDLDVPPSRYVNQDMLFGDCNSLDGLNRFTANSLDAFQSCLFFSSLDRKEIGGG